MSFTASRFETARIKRNYDSLGLTSAEQPLSWTPATSADDASIVVVTRRNQGRNQRPFNGLNETKINIKKVSIV